MRRLKLEPSDLNVQVTQVLDFVRPKAQEGRIEVVDYLSSDLATVPLDRESFHGALLNLVLNAQQAMPEGGQLVVRTYNMAQGALIVTLPPAVAASRRGGTSLSLGEGRDFAVSTPFAKAQGRATRR